MTTDTKTRYQDIIARLEKATGPNYGLDVAVAHAAGYWPEERIDKIVEADDGGYTIWFTEGPDLPLPPNFSVSLDATIALIERVLPGVNVTMGWGEPNRNPWCSIAPIIEAKGGRVPFTCGGYNHALAALSALFHALEAKEKP